MPVEFLTDDQARSYGRYAGEPTASQLARYFYLDEDDRELLADSRHLYVRPDGRAAAVVASVAAQLSIPGNTDMAPYGDGEAHWDHAALIRKRYGYRDFGEQPEYFKLVRWLYTRAWLSTERPSILFDLATAWLIERKILLPGVSVLARLVASVRDRAAARVWRAMSAPTVPTTSTLVLLMRGSFRLISM